MASQASVLNNRQERPETGPSSGGTSFSLERELNARNRPERANTAKTMTDEDNFSGVMAGRVYF